MPVGFIGLGNMGQGMADNLLTKGADLTVFTRTQSKIETMIDKSEAKGIFRMSHQLFSYGKPNFKYNV